MQILLVVLQVDPLIQTQFPLTAVVLSVLAIFEQSGSQLMLDAAQTSPVAQAHVVSLF